MQGGGDDVTPPLPGRRVLINPREMTPNPDLPEAVWEALLVLPSQALPQRGARPVKRLTALAHELAFDGLLPNAGKRAHAQMHKVLNAARARYADEITAARQAVLVVEGTSLIADLNAKARSLDEFWEAADVAVVEDAYRRAARILRPDLARTWAEALADQDTDADSEDDALMDAHAEIAALGLVPEVKDYLDAEADKLAKGWLTTHRVAIKALSDERQEVYRQLRAMSTEPAGIDLTRPRSWMEATSVREADGRETPLPTFQRHLLCDEHGDFPVAFDSDWERDVLRAEMGRPGFLAWYRNPPRATQESLGIAYEVSGQTRIMRPDFLFFAQQADGTVVADLIDPHGTQFSDALPKLQGLARYAEAHGAVYRRIEAVARVGDTLRVLDLTDAAVRQAVAAGTDALGLYAGALASDYCG